MPLPDTAQRVADLLKSLGHDKPVVMLPETGKTSAAAGHPHAVFNLTPQQLLAMTGAPVVDVALQVTA